MSLLFGRIVWAEIADPNGIAKVRPAVVVTPSEQISTVSKLAVVAITSRLDKPLPADHVMLPWHPQGQVRTQLTRRCAAVCSWIAEIMPADIQDVGGIVPGPLMLEIVKKIAAGPSPTQSG